MTQAYARILWQNAPMALPADLVIWQGGPVALPGGPMTLAGWSHVGHVDSFDD